MTEAAVQMLFPEAVTEFGLVISLSGRRARVKTPSGERWADIAASCLLAPDAGDRVLVAHAGEEAYVLSVLRRSRDEEARIVFDKNVSLSAPNGRLRVMAEEGVDIESPESLSVRAKSLVANAEQFQIGFELLNLVGKSIASKSKKVRLVAETVDTVAGRIYERAVNFLRRTDELDRVEAKNMELRAEHLIHVHAENAVTTAEELVKIDGSQVHVG
ncbi:MAG: DUF3540 domain-containing protein [Polyangiaceae bacterium]|nr:DUF3540 domain-containing protein [Polyangiaceae bacterium]